MLGLKVEDTHQAISRPERNANPGMDALLFDGLFAGEGKLGHVADDERSLTLGGTACDPLARPVNLYAVDEFWTTVVMSSQA